MLVTNCQTFDFPNLYMYDFFAKKPEFIPS